MALNWAGRRRLIIIGGTVVVFLLLALGVTLAVLYEVPTCTDQKQNQDEQGIDCGGSCSYLCTASFEAPRVSFARPIQGANGRVDIIAYIENRNVSAEAANATFTVELYGEENILIAERKGMIDLPSRSIIPVFMPGLYQGNSVATRAFLSFDDPVRFNTAVSGRVVPKIEETKQLPGDRPRITAQLRNPSARALYNVKVVATIFAEDGTAIAVSQTVVREVPALGVATAIFTWNEPFPVPVSRIEVLPVLSFQ